MPLHDIDIALHILGLARLNIECTLLTFFNCSVQYHHEC